MKNIFFKFLERIDSTFNNKDQGWSARKLTSFWFVAVTSLIEFVFVYYVLKSCVDIIHHSSVAQYYLVIELLWLLIYICIVNLLLVLVLLGVVTFEQIIKFKDSKNIKQPEEKTNEK